MNTNSGYVFQFRTALQRIGIYLIKLSLTVYCSVLIINYFDILPHKVDFKDLAIITLGTCLTELTIYLYRRYHNRRYNNKK